MKKLITKSMMAFLLAIVSTNAMANDNDESYAMNVIMVTESTEAKGIEFDSIDADASYSEEDIWNAGGQLESNLAERAPTAVQLNY